MKGQQHTRQPSHSTLKSAQNVAPSTITVCVRVRPLLAEHEDGEAWNINLNTHSICSTLDSTTALQGQQAQYLGELSLRSRKRLLEASYNQVSFQFEHLEGQREKTQFIYSRIGRSIVLKAIEGFHGAILCYGQTTSGKTYTMLGNPNNPGILPCALRDIFLEVEQRALAGTQLFTVCVSYLEIYNEQVNDLLNPKATNLKLQDDSRWGTEVKGLKMERVWTFEQAILLMNFGEEHRKYRETRVNDHSSRSHTVFRVYIENQQAGDPESGNGITAAATTTTRYSCLHFVDLAGSERLTDGLDAVAPPLQSAGAQSSNQSISYSARSEQQNSIGETGHINRSLFVLTNVVNKLADGTHKHIPYRDSKLTRIIAQALSGNSLTSIVCCVSPAVCNFNQTLSTLRFAQRAKTVQIRPEVNEMSETNLSAQLQQYALELDKFQQENQELEKQNRQLSAKVVQLEEKIQHSDSETRALELKLETERNRCEGLQQQLNAPHNDTQQSNGDKKQTFNNSEPSYVDTLVAQLSPSIVQAIHGQSNRELALQQLQDALQRFSDSYRQQMTEVQKRARENVLQIVTQYAPGLALVQDEGASEERLWHHAQQTSLSVAAPGENSSLEISFPHCDEQLKGAQSAQNKSFPFNELAIDFSDIIRLHTQYEERLLEEFIRDRHELLLRQLEDQYAQARLTLENTCRQKLQQRPPPQDSALYISSPHAQLRVTHEFDAQLRILREAFDNAQENLRVEFDSANAQLRAKITQGNQYQQQSLEELTLREIVTNSSARNSQEKQPASTRAYFAYVWGSGRDGRLGLGDSKTQRHPRAIQSHKFVSLTCAYHSSAAIDSRGRLFLWGRNEKSYLGVASLDDAVLEPKCITNFGSTILVKQVASGWQHTLALTGDGQLFAWGANDEGQLGLAHFEERSKPEQVKHFSSELRIQAARVAQVAAGHSHSAAVDVRGDLWMFGCNPDHRLGLKHNKGNQCVPALALVSQLRKQLPETYTELQDVALGVNHTAVVLKNGLLFTFGNGTDGQLGIELTEQTPNTFFSSNLQASAQIQDLSHSYSSASQPVDGGGEEQGISFFGTTTNGQQVQGQVQEKFSSLVRVECFGATKKNGRAMRVSCGENYTLILNEKSHLYSCGRASFSRLGQQPIDGRQCIYEPQLIKALATEKIADFSAGVKHAAVVTQDGKVYAWGFNFYDQLGIGESHKDIGDPTRINKLAGLKVKSVSCGLFHSMALVE